MPSIEVGRLARVAFHVPCGVRRHNVTVASTGPAARLDEFAAERDPALLRPDRRRHALGEDDVHGEEVGVAFATTERTWSATGEGSRSNAGPPTPRMTVPLIAMTTPRIQSCQAISTSSGPPITFGDDSPRELHPP